jgi:hypothetical protein
MAVFGTYHIAIKHFGAYQSCAQYLRLPKLPGPVDFCFRQFCDAIGGVLPRTRRVVSSSLTAHFPRIIPIKEYYLRRKYEPTLGHGGEIYYTDTVPQLEQS